MAARRVLVLVLLALGLLLGLAAHSAHAAATEEGTKDKEAAAGGGFAPEEEDDDDGGVAVELTEKMYEDILASTDAWIIDYYQEDCYACKQLKPMMDQVAQEMHPFGIKVGIFDIAQSKTSKKLAVAAGLVKLPALKMFVGPATKNPYTGKLLRPSVDYPFQENQQVDARMVKRLFTKQMPSHVARTTAGEYEPLLESAFGEGKGVVLTLTDRETTPMLLKAMALKYRDSYVFAEAPPSETDFLLAFGVEKEDLAQLYVLQPSKGISSFLLESLNKTAALRFEGDLRQPTQLQRFLEAHVEKKAKPQKKEEKQAKKEGEKDGAKPAAGKGPVVHAIDAANFREKVVKDTDAWLVWFKPKADATSADWDKHVAKAEGLLKVGVVDCGVAGSGALCDAEGGRTYPFKAYPHGGDKEDDAKGFGKVEDAYADAGESVPDVLRRLGDGGNQMVMDQEVNLAFQSGRLPVLVVTNKPEPALLFKALALRLEPFLSFLLISSPSPQTLARLNNAAVPSVHILVPQDMDLYKDPGQGLPTQHALRIETYLPGFFGPMRFATLSNFFAQVLAARVDPAAAQRMANLVNAVILGKNPEEIAGADAGPGGAGAGAGGKRSGGRNGTAPGVVPQVTDAASWAAACTGQGLLCVVGLFNGQEEDNGSVQASQAVLKEVAALEAEAPWAFSWADAGCLAGFADAFDVQAPKLPTVVVYSGRKQRFASYKGTLSVRGVREFLSGILSGSIPTAPVLREPAVDEQCAGAAGGAGGADEAAVVEEDDEDIGDLMAEILAEEQRKKEELAAAVKREMEAAAAKAEASDGEPKKKIVRRKKKKAKDEL